MFDILATIMGNLDDEAEALALAKDLEDYFSRVRRLAFLVEVRDNRQGLVIRKRNGFPAGN